MRRLDQLWGRTPEPISPLQPAESWTARQIFAEPIGHRDDIDRAASLLMARLSRALSEAGLGARRMVLSFFRVDGTVQRLMIGTSRPCHAASLLLRLFDEKLDKVDPGFGIEVMALEATVVEPVSIDQATLDGDTGEGDVAALIDRLQNRLGRDRVLELKPVESHVPERAEVGRAALSGGVMKNAVLPSRSSRAGPLYRLSTKAARPIKLLSHPEPIEAMAPVPDDPPLTFRWRRVTHRVSLADGPERIGPEWWKPKTGRPRDYYRVEDSEGRRFWIYREGLYGAAGDPPRWFLHGFFP